MAVSRRNWLAAAALSLPLLGSYAPLTHASGTATVATFPSKPVKLIVPYPAGGIVDISARIIAEGLSKQWSQPVLVENRPGGNANIGAEVVRKAAPDGHTLLLGSSFLVLNPLTDPATRYRTQDFAPVVELGSAPTVFVVPASLPVASLQDFIALAKQQPKQFNAAIPGINTTNKLALERLFDAAGLELEQVLYQGQPPYLADLANNRVQIASVTSTLAMPFIQSGQLKPLAAISNRRIPALPQVPALPELGLQSAIVDGFSGLFAPQGTPTDVLTTIRQAVDRVHQDPSVQARLEAQHLRLPQRDHATSFATIVQQDWQRWSQHFKVAAAPSGTLQR